MDKPIPVAVENPQNIGDLPRVPEFQLKQRKIKSGHREKLAAKTKLQIAKAVRGRRQPKAINFKRLEWFVERANRREWERIRVLREARKPTTVQESNLDNLPAKTSDCPSVLIIRTCRKQNMTKVTKKLLNQFRLQRVYQACLARLDQQMMNKLSILKECVVWGHVAPTTVRDLIMKRGRMGTMSNATGLTDNVKIEESLGSHGVICLEDLVFELSESSAKSFQICNQFLLPFQLSLPEGGKRAVTNFEEKAVAPGYRKEEEFKTLIDKMV